MGSTIETGGNQGTAHRHRARLGVGEAEAARVGEDATEQALGDLGGNFNAQGEKQVVDQLGSGGRCGRQLGAGPAL